MKKKLNSKELKDFARKIRGHALDMALESGQRGSHISGSLSSVEIYAVLYGAILNYDLENPLWEDRDRFIAGKEHARLAEFPARAEMGFFPVSELSSYEKNDGLLVGHQINKKIGIEYCSMSLGMEMPFVVGKAIYAKKNHKKYHIYCLLGDAECEEGSVWEAFMNAAHYKLDNLTVIIDRNYMSVDGNTEEFMAQLDMQKKLEAFGWEARTVNGHDIDQLLEALTYHPHNQPYAVIAETIKGKGISFIENNPKWHQYVINIEEYNKAKEEIKNNII